MSKPVLAFDADGVFTDFLTPACALAKEMWGVDVKPEDIKTWEFTESLGIEITKAMRRAIYDRMKVVDYSENIPVYPGAVDFVKWAQTVGDVHIVTSPMNSRHWHYERDVLFGKHFGIDRNHVHHVNAKWLCAAADVFVEDKPKNLGEWLSWTRHRTLGVLFVQPYNEHESVFYTPRHNDVQCTSARGYDELKRRIISFIERTDHPNLCIYKTGGTLGGAI